MTRRPLCLLCMVFMAGMVLLDLLGFPLVRGNPLPEHVAEWLQETPSVSILGEVISCAETDSGKSVILKYVRDYAALGRFYELIKFIERTIPNVRIFYLIKLFIIIVFQTSSKNSFLFV